MSSVYDWFQERLEIQAIADDITSKYVPPHVATGFAMTFYYRPTVTEAFASVEYLMTEVNFGWLIRSVHRWSASYSLPWDQVGYWACKIVTGVPDAIPVVGGLIVQVLRGGVSVGQSTLTRFYSAHTFVLPVVAAVLMLTHFVMIRKQGVLEPTPLGEKADPFATPLEILPEWYFFPTFNLLRVQIT
eukprot:scaffold52076_cov1961-Isochrysis_galbana.AAC.1